MDIKELIHTSRLSEARRQLVEEVKSSPGDIEKRSLLFQVLLFFGQWDKAEGHLDSITALEPKREIGALPYKSLIHAEKERVTVFNKSFHPTLLSNTPSYYEKYLNACKKIRDNDTNEAQKLFAQIDTERPVVSGTVNGNSFTGLRDTDSIFSYFLEAIVYDRYVWIAFEEIKELTISQPKTLLDLLWIPSHIVLWDKMTLNCYLPVLYPDSCDYEDDKVKCGHMTEWIPCGGSFVKGYGQHVFQIGEEDMALLSVKEIVFNAPERRSKE